MNIEYIIYNNELIIKDKNNDKNNIKINNINTYFIIITLFLNNNIKQLFFHNFNTKNIIDSISNIIENDHKFIIQINLSFIISSKFIQSLRDNFLIQFNTQIKNGYQVLILKEKNIIKSTSGSFIKLSTNINRNINLSNSVHIYDNINNNKENKTQKLFDDHQKIQKYLYKEQIQDQLKQLLDNDKKENLLLKSLNKKRDELNKKVDSSNCKQLKNIINEMDKCFNDRKNNFDNNIKEELNFIKNTINYKLDSIDNRKKTLEYIENLNKQKVMWIELIQNKINQYNIDQKNIDKYLQELEKKYKDEAINEVEIFKKNINSLIDKDNIKKDLMNILKFKKIKNKLFKKYDEEYVDIKKIEDNYNKNKEEYVNTMKNIVKEWSDKKKEEYNKKQEKDKELFEKKRVKYLKSCEDALQFNFDNFLNKCEEIKNKFKFNYIDNFVQKENNEKIKQLVKKEIDSQKEKWNKLNNEKIRLDNILKHKKILQLEENERRKKEEIEIKRERKKLKLEEERKRIREERESRKKGLNKSLRIW